MIRLAGSFSNGQCLCLTHVILMLLMQRRKSAGVTKALAIAERTNEKTRKVRQRSEKKKASKALWEGDAS